MRFSEVLAVAARQGGAAPGGGPPELFPDPTLANTDTTNWAFVGTFASAGSADITISSTGTDAAFMPLGEADGDALDAAWADSTQKLVTLTIANFAAAGVLGVSAKDAGATAFNITGNGPFGANVTAGTDGSMFGVFRIDGQSDGASFTVTAISVT